MLLINPDDIGNYTRNLRYNQKRYASRPGQNCGAYPPRGRIRINLERGWGSLKGSGGNEIASFGKLYSTDLVRKDRLLIHEQSLGESDQERQTSAFVG